LLFLFTQTTVGLFLTCFNSNTSITASKVICFAKLYFFLKKNKMIGAILKSSNQPLVVEQVDIEIQNNDFVEVNMFSAALNHRDLWITKGQYAGIKFPIILGSDGCGAYQDQEVVINPSLYWGANERVQASDYQVLGLPLNGTFASSVWIPSSQLYPKPPHLNRLEAAALPLAGLTAYRVLFTRCGLTSGKKVLVTGAGGGVALFAVQFALSVGAEVWVTTGSEEKLERLKAMGVAGGVNYRMSGWDQVLKAQTGGFDVLIDSAAGDAFSALVGLCRPGASIGIYGGTMGKISQISPQILFWKQISIHGSTMGTASEFEAMLAMVTNFKIHPVIDTIFPLSEVNLALKRMEEGAQFGKIVLQLEE
jgi:NADPH:quinone reductase-like Zn-dependent oxidoreductase